MMSLTSTSPNTEHEIQSDDKISEQGQFSHSFKQKTIYLCVEMFFITWHLIDYGTEPLNWLDTLLVIIITAAFALRMWCYAILGRFFTFTLCVKPAHHLITVGPYKYLVHPSYTGQLVTMFGILLFLKAYIFFVMLLAFTLWKLPSRMGAEEKMMQKEFKEEYDVYTSTRKRLIPFVY